MAEKMNHRNGALLICIDQVSGDQISGRVLGSRLVEPIEFQDLTTMLLRVEDILDAQCFPKAFQRIRTFRPIPMLTLAEGEQQGIDMQQLEQAGGQVDTLWLYVLTRQNTSWQGFVAQMNGSLFEQFDSELALLTLLRKHLQK